ncbi:MAG: integrase core domain-containing protein [Gemmatimonadaceae bacterium]
MIDAFNGSLRRECLSQHWFVDLADAQRTLDAYREDYKQSPAAQQLREPVPGPLPDRGTLHPRPKPASKLAAVVA